MAIKVSLPSRTDKGRPVQMPRPPASPPKPAPSGGVRPRTFAPQPPKHHPGVPIKNPSGEWLPGGGAKTVGVPRMRVFVATRPAAPSRQPPISEEIRAELGKLTPELAAGVRRVGGSK